MIKASRKEDDFEPIVIEITDRQSAEILCTILGNLCGRTIEQITNNAVTVDELIGNDVPMTLYQALEKFDCFRRK